MISRIPLPKPFATAIALTGVLTLVPVSMDSDQEFVANDACAGGRCCMELQSFCGQLAGYYEAVDKCGPSLPGGDDIQ